MVKRMLIDATHSEETRVVVVSGNRLEEFDFETSTKKQLKGNIYLAKVTRVEPSLQAAFVDYGGNRHGFLAFSEIHPDYYRIPIEDRQALLAETEGDTDQDDEETPAAKANAADENGKASADDDSPGDDEEGAETSSRANGEDAKPLETLGGDDVEDMQSRNRRFQRRYRIQEVISRRQILLVQVTKEERGNKGAALTTYISLAGRYCVLMPNTPRGGGISRKISNAADRKKLKTIVEDLDIPAGMAVIVRTAGSQRTKAELRRDYDFLIRLWDEIRETTLSSTAPALVYEEADLIKRSMRDLYSKDIDEIFVEGDEGYKAAKAFMKQLIPSHAKRIQPYTDPSIPLFHRYQVESQLDSIHSPTVQLKSGGYIVMNSTEALVAIDVNSGKSTRERNIEETAYRTNLEAAEEIARQLRLRDLAGLIVIDFIDMEESRNRHNVERKLKESMRTDRARIQLGRISPFGLLELSRQRLRPSILEASAQACPTCAGTGVVRSTESTALHVLRAIEEEGMRQRSARLTIYVPTAVAFYILNQKRAGLTGIEERYGFEVFIEHDDSLIPPDFRLEREAVEGEEEEEAPREKARAEPRREGADRDRGRRRGGRRRREDDDDSSRSSERSAERTAERPDDRPANQASDGADESAGEERTDDRGNGGNGRRADDDQEQQEARGRRRGRRGGRRRRRGRDRDADGATTQAAASDDQDAATQPVNDGENGEDRRPTEADISATADAPAESQVDAPAAETSEEPAKPRRRSRRRTKPAEATSESVAAETNVEAEAAPVELEATPAGDTAAADAPQPATDDAPAETEAPVKKPRRRRAVKAKPAEETSGDTGSDAADAPVDEKAAKPKAAPRRRRKAADTAAPKGDAPKGDAPEGDAPEGTAPEGTASEGTGTVDAPTSRTRKAAPARTRANGATKAKKAAKAAEPVVETAPEAAPEAAPEPAPEPAAESGAETPAVEPVAEEKPKKRRRGWWALGS